MWHLGISFRDDYGGATLMVGLDDLKASSKPDDSLIL